MRAPDPAADRRVPNGRPPLKYALHYKRNSTEFRFGTLKEFWAYVRANGLCTVEADDIAHAGRLLSPDFEIHDYDIDGVVRIEGRDSPLDGG